MSCLHVVTCVRIENIYYVFYALFPISHGGRSHRCGTQYYVRNTYFVSNGQAGSGMKASEKASEA